MLIGGERVESASRAVIEVENPANEEVIATAPAGDAADACRALEAARDAQGKWAALPAVKRGEMLLSLTKKCSKIVSD